MFFRPFEEAFDNGYLVILETQGVFTAHWLGDDVAQIAEPKTYPWSSNSSEKMDEASLKILRR